MPSSANYKRNYKQEYAASQSSDEEKKNRAARNGARRTAMREGKVSKGDGKDMAHKKALSKGGGNAVKVESAGANRSFARNKDGSMQSERSKRERK